MKNITLSIICLLFSFLSYSQTTCPASIKSNSTPAEPTFVLSNGQNGCNEVTWPTTILVDGLTYSYVSCSGGNLKYAIDAGQTPPSSFEVTVDYGNGLICEYDVNGLYKDSTLSINDINKSINELVTIYPNPTNNSKSINFGYLKNMDSQISIYDITGKTILKESFSIGDDVTFNITNLQTGIYIAQIVTDDSIFNKKIIISN